MELTHSDKVQSLLFLLQFHYAEIVRREEREQKWFEWTAGSIMAAFGVVLALARSSTAIANPVIIKVIASALIALPTFLMSSRMLWQRKMIVGYAKAVEYIEKALNVFQKDYYGVPYVLPKEWEGQFSTSHRKRKEPQYYIGILILMAVCVIATIWIVL